MSEETNIVVDTAVSVLRDLSTPTVINAAEGGEWPAALWNTLEETGLSLTWVPDTLGGAGGEMADGFGVIRAAGMFASPVPLAETMLAGMLLARADLASPNGPMTIAPVCLDDDIALDGGGLVRGRARAVPFARAVDHLAVLAKWGDGYAVALVPASAVRITEGLNLAGEPSDFVEFDGAQPVASAPARDASPEAMFAWGAVVRATQMAGGLERILNQSIQYASERVQFGKAISKFQVIQHNLAILAGEVAAASAAADAAAEAIAFGSFDERVMIEVATAKIRAGEAASIGAAIAHQVHGAIGFTYEHSLHHTTRRLWSWRDQFGSESYWSARLGQVAARLGADELWPLVTRSAAVV